MPRQIEFWFEFASTYSHIAVQRLEAEAAQAGVPVVWRPFLLGPIFAAQGWADSPFNLYPAKGAYMWRDLERECARFGVPFRRPTVFPRQGLTAARVALVGEGQAWLPEFVRAIYRANYRDDLEIDAPGVLLGALKAAGCPSPQAAVEAARSPRVKARLRDVTGEAAA